MWKITKDNISNGEAVREEVGSPDYFLGDTDKSKPPMVYKFRMLDDDGEIYYEGVSSYSCSFEPLYDFGMPNDGCTDIQYLENGKWEVL